jgi:hypothetical protein
MISITCDACKKGIAGASKNVNYVAMLDKDICLDCQDALWDTTKQQMKARRPYTFKDYRTLLIGNLGQMTRR